jgi:hypothetical protein
LRPNTKLSRADLRPRRCDNYSTAPRPRSGLGLNDLLGLIARQFARWQEELDFAATTASKQLKSISEHEQLTNIA